MSITRAALDNDRVTLTALALVLVAGLASYASLPRSEDPGYVVRAAKVTTYFPGASPRRVERLITDELEKAIQEMPELEYLRSESQTGVSDITVRIQERYADMQPIWDRLRRKVERAARDLPEGVRGPYVNDEFGDVFGIIVALVGDGFSYAEMKEVADEVRDEILYLDDVAKVELYGTQEERIFVEYRNARLAELGVSPLQLRQTLEAQNIIIPGGDITTRYEKIVLEPTGSFESIEDLERTIIQLPGRTEVVYLRDLAQVSRGYVDPPRTRMRASGEPAIGLAISMAEGGNVIDLGERLDALLERLRAHYPIGIDFETIQHQPTEVRRKVDDFVGNLLQAIGIVALVMLLTLGLRTGLVVSSLVPSAMLMSLAVMSIAGIGLDQVSLAALIIALGMLVDNAIVMSESILVQLEAGRSRREAVLDSARELQVPLLTSSLTTAAAFLPIYLAESSAGEYTSPIFSVVTITLLSSWLLSLTVIPLLCHRFLRVAPSAGGTESRSGRLYRKALALMLRHRMVALLVVLLAFVAAMRGFGHIPFIFFPPNDRPTFTAELSLPAGSPIQRTEEVVREIERFMQEELRTGPDRPTGIVSWGAFIGQGAPRFLLPYNPEKPSPDYAYLVINATSRAAVDDLVPRLDAHCAETFPDVKAIVRPLETGPSAWPPVAVRLSGRDLGTLFHIVDEVKSQLGRMSGTRAIDDDWGARAKKLVVEVDQERAYRAGVTSRDVAISLQTFLTGLETTDYREDDDLIPIVLRSAAAERQSFANVQAINVHAQATGRSVPIKQVADMRLAWEPARIHHYDLMPTVTVEATLTSGVTPRELNHDLISWLQERQQQWPPGYTWEIGGAVETSERSRASIRDQLPIAALLIVLLLVGQFNSIRRPLIILATIPLALIGVVIGLLVADSYFGFMTLLGIVSLAGIVINNAIVLLDRVRIEIDENGLAPAEALLESGQRRLRPILLTTATTVGGLLPLWLGGGAMWEPMAVAIIFGLLVSTVLTLFVVPILYATLFRVRATP